MRDRSGVQVLAASVLWVAGEQLRGAMPFGGFPWGLLAFSQTDAPLLRHASLGGTPLVSAAVVIVGGLLGTAVRRIRARESAATGRVLAAAALVALGPGAIRVGTAPQAGTIVVGAVQGNVPAPGSDALAQARKVAGNHLSGTRDLLRRVGPDRLDVVVVPESSSDIDPRADRALGEAVEAVARAVGVPILLCRQRFAPPIRYNDYLVWQTGLGVTDTYSKQRPVTQRPVTFGEYIPYRAFFRRLSPDVDRVSTDMAAGTGIGPLKVPIVRLGREIPITTAICFEVAYDIGVRRLSRRPWGPRGS